LLDHWGTQIGNLLRPLSTEIRAIPGRDYWRDELCSALGVVNLWRMRSGAGQRVEVY